MVEIDWLPMEIVGDTLCRDRAVEVLDEFWRERRLGILTCEGKWPVRRNQLSTIRQIARQQPHKMMGFAKHQQERAEAKARHGTVTDEIAFWNLLGRMCHGRVPIKEQWSLDKQAEAMVPAALLDPLAGQTRSQLSTEQRQRCNALKKDRRQWIDNWNKRVYPAFFQHFCAHYLYLATRTDQV